MRHVFIVNPAAGKKRGALELLPRIHAAFAGAEEGAYAIRERLCPVLRGNRGFSGHSRPGAWPGRPGGRGGLRRPSFYEQRVHGDGRRRGTEDGAV